MSDDEPKHLPALLAHLDPGAEARARIGNAVAIRNPLRALVHSIGNNAAIASLHSQGQLAGALAWSIDEHTKAVGAMDRLHTAVEQYHAHRLGIVQPEELERLEEERHKRALGKMRRERELYDAEQQALEAKHRLEATEEFKDQKFAAGKARFDQKVAERQVGAAVARSSMEPESKEVPAPEKPASMAAVLAVLVHEMEKDIDAAEAAGKPTKQMRDDAHTLNALLKRL